MKNILRNSNFGFTKWCGALIAALMTFATTGWGQTTSTINFDTAANWTQGGATGFTSYSNHSYSESNWSFTGALVIRNTTTLQDSVAGALGTYSWRLQDAAGSALTATFNSEGTITAFGFNVRRWDNTPDPSYAVEYSTNSGSSWTSTGTTINNAYLVSSNWKTFTFSLSSPATVTSGQFRIRVTRSTGERIMIDNFQWTAAASSVATITLNPATPNLSAFTTTAGTASAAQTFAVTGSNLTADVLVSAPTGFEVSQDGTSFASSQTLTQSGGTLASKTISVRIAAATAQGSPSGNVTLASTGATTANVAVSGTVQAANAATISTSGSLTSFSSYFGFASAAQTFTVSGSNLTESIVVVAPTGYQVSLDGTSFSSTRSISPDAGSVTSTAVHVRVSASAAVGAANGSITLASAGVDPSVAVAVTGTVTTPVLSVTLSPTTVAENAGASASTGTVSLPAGLSAPAGGLAITLVSSDTTEATVPSSVTIAEGASSATFAVAAVTDNTFELSNQSSTITASRTNFTSGTAVLTVTNVDAEPILTIEIAAKNSPYSQNFNGLGSTTINNSFSGSLGVQTSIGVLGGVTGMNGWYGVQLAGTTTTSSPLTASSTVGSSAAAGLYNLGSSTSERALGSLAAGSRGMAFGAIIKNTSTETINNLAFSLTGEYWRTSTTQQNRLAFAHGKLGGAVTESNFLSSGLASSDSTLDIVGPAVVATTTASLDGNLSGNRTLLTNIGLSDLSLLPGETMFIRWSDADDNGSDAALAIDDLTITAVDVALGKPVFELVGGMYFESKTLKFSNFSSYAAGVEIRYTTDGSNPTASSSLYNNATGIPLASGSGSVTVKAIAVDPTPEPDSTSFVATSSYNLPTVIEVSNLTALRAGANNTSAYYRVTGPVTYTGGHANRNTKFFQDSGAGIQIDDAAGVVTTSYNAGDNVSGLFGQLSVLSSGQLQFTPAQDFGAPTSTGNVVTPINRTLATLTDNDQSMLVTLANVEYQAANGTATFGAQFTNLNVKDPSLTGFTGWFRNIFGTPLASEVIPSGSVTVTGIVQRTSISNVSYLTVGARGSAEAGVPAALRLSWSVDLEIPESGLYFDPEYQYLTLSRVGNSTGELQVLISCNPESRLSLQNGGVLPQTIIIPAGTDSTQVKLIPVNDSVYRGNTLVTITATAVNHTVATASASILEDEVPDTIKPVIALIGDNPLLLANGATYTDPGATVTDNVDATRTIQGTGTVNTTAAGDYTITYNATDAAGNAAIAVLRTVRVAGPVVLESTYAGWSGGAALDSAGLAKYAIGGANSLTGNDGVKPTTALTGGFLVITAIVRTDNSNLTVVGQAVTDLANYASNTSVTVVQGVEIADQSGVPAGHKRKTFSVAQGTDARKFMRLSASLALSGTNTTVSVARDSGGATFLQVTGATAGTTSGGTATSGKRTIYYYAPDTTSSPTYTGGAWPYVIVQGQLMADFGVTAILTKNSSGMLLVNGLPAYQYVGDSGSTTASGVSGAWPAMRADGTKTPTGPSGTIQ
jgi:hypothetical protein